MAGFLKRKIKRLTELQLKEISGVDHPASLHEGWAVLKSSDNELEQALSDVINPIPEPLEKNVETETTEIEAEVVEETVVKETDDSVRKDLERIEKELSDLRKENTKLKEDSAMEKAVNDSQKWAIVPQLDPAEFAPVLRSLREADAESTETIESILDAVAVALGAAGVLKEVGSDGSPENEDSYGQIETMAKALVESGGALSLADGISKVATDNPELYSAYVAEMGA